MSNAKRLIEAMVREEEKKDNETKAIAKIKVGEKVMVKLDGKDVEATITNKDKDGEDKPEYNEEKQLYLVKFAADDIRYIAAKDVKKVEKKEEPGKEGDKEAKKEGRHKTKAGKIINEFYDNAYDQYSGYANDSVDDYDEYGYSDYTADDGMEDLGLDNDMDDEDDFGLDNDYEEDDLDDEYDYDIDEPVDVVLDMPMRRNRRGY